MKISKAVGSILAVVSVGVSSTSALAAETGQAQFSNSPAAAGAKLPFSQAVRVGDIWYRPGDAAP